MRVRCTVNGRSQTADGVWEGESLLYVLRERFGLPGSKNACEQGECGSCSVYMDGNLVCACLVAAGQAHGHEVMTVEGLASGDVLHLLTRTPRPTTMQIREALAGNICRCTGYAKIIDAVHLAAERMALR
jgi:carbon-monoxide dehydrogenase small subunit